ERARTRRTRTQHGGVSPTVKGSVGMMTRRRLIGLVVLGGAGCARSDWIESTLVTVDVTGEWTGEWVQPQFNGALRLVLNQEGSRVSGELVSFTGTLDMRYTGPVEGTVTGDVVVLRQT